MQSLFIIRSTGYQIGVVAVFVSTGLCLLGLVAPMWLYHYDNIPTIEDERFAGPVVGCRIVRWNYKPGTFEKTMCSFGFLETFSGERYTPSKEMFGRRYMDKFAVGPWVHAVEFFDIVGLLVLCGSCTYILMDNCCKIYPGSHTRIIEITAIVGGCFCFLATMIFAGKMRESVENTIQTSFAWAFVLTIIGSLAAIASGIVVFIFNKPIPKPGTSTTRITIGNDYSTVINDWGPVVPAKPLVDDPNVLTRY